MIDTQILQALQTASIAAAAASSIPTIAIKAVGRTSILNPDKTAYSGNKWLEFINIVNNGSDSYWGLERVYQGIFRVILHWPIDDAGPYPATSFIDSFAAYFSKDTRLTQGDVSVQLYQNPSASGIVNGGSELLFPLSLPYRCFRQ